MNKALFPSFALIVTVGVGHPANAAQPVPAPPNTQPEVATKMAEASAAFEARDYDRALEAFQAAYAIDEDPNFLFNIGRVYEEAGELALAVEYYDRFMREPGVKLENRKFAYERVTVLRPIVEDADRKNAVEESDETNAPPPTAPVPTPNRAGNGLVIGGAVLVGLGGASLATGGVLAGLGQRDARRVDSAGSPEEREELEQSARRQATAGDALLIGGGIVAAVGIPILITGLVRRARGRRGSTSAGLKVLPTGRGVAVTMQF